jgi:NAD(P)-dependent dehydrogenase (short-subunit alcohol dehydrogenase family)
VTGRNPETPELARRAAAGELARSAVNAISPGPIETPIVGKMGLSAQLCVQM